MVSFLLILDKESSLNHLEGAVSINRGVINIARILYVREERSVIWLADECKLISE